jgi:hypothetical protein
MLAAHGRRELLSQEPGPTHLGRGVETLFDLVAASEAGLVVGGSEGLGG